MYEMNVMLYWMLINCGGGGLTEAHSKDRYTTVEVLGYGGTNQFEFTPL